MLRGPTKLATERISDNAMCAKVKEREMNKGMPEPLHTRKIG